MLSNVTFSPRGISTAFAAVTVEKDVSFPLGLVADVVLTFGCITEPVNSNVDNVVGFVGSKSDVGTSIVGGETVAQASEFKRSAIISLIKNAGIGRLLTSKTGRAILTGYRNIPDNKFVNLVFTELGIVASDLVRQNKQQNN